MTLCRHLPRFPLASLPTPLEDAPRLSESLGVRLLIKREDLAGLCAGGNKARLMELVLGRLAAEGTDTLIASAAAQSNKLREIAAAAARAGMRAVLLLPGPEPAEPAQGNRLLYDLLGAEVRWLAPGTDPLEAQTRAAEEIAAEGARPAVLDRHLDYGILATLAYVDAAEELLGQLRARGIAADHVYVTAGAGMTAAGLALGLALHGSTTRVTGVCVASDAATLAPEIVAHAGRAAAVLGAAGALGLSGFDLDDTYLAPGYGVVTPALVEAMRTFATLHGMVLDPVYNAKTALALLARVRAGRHRPGETIVYVNTGGAPGLFAKSDAVLGVGG